MGFKVGDRVVATYNQDGAKITGMRGAILSVDSQYVVVEFDDAFREGHSGNHQAKGKQGHCWSIRLDGVKLINDTLMEFIGDKFYNKRVSVIQNGNAYKLTKTDGKVLYTIIPTQGVSRIISTKDKTEKMYIELFEQVIEEFNNAKEVI